MKKEYQEKFKCMSCGLIDTVKWETGESSMHPDCIMCGSLYFIWLNYEEMFGK